MKIEDFVKEVLIEIATAVTDAGQILYQKGVYINPGASNANPNIVVSSNDAWGGRRIQQVDFDISVSVSDKSEGKAGISLIAGVFGVGASKKEITDNISYHRVKFNVPISYPVVEGPVAE